MSAQTGTNGHRVYKKSDMDKAVDQLIYAARRMEAEIRRYIRYETLCQVEEAHAGLENAVYSVVVPQKDDPNSFCVFRSVISHVWSVNLRRFIPGVLMAHSWDEQLGFLGTVDQASAEIARVTEYVTGQCELLKPHLPQRETLKPGKFEQS